MAETVRLEVVSNATKFPFERGHSPAFTGAKGPIDMECGVCGWLAAVGLASVNQVIGGQVQCPECGATLALPGG